MKEIARWDCCGQGPVEQYIMEDFLDYENDGNGAIGALDGWELEDLLRFKNEEDLNGPQLIPSEPIWPTREYYLYYNYHSSSGYHTKILGADSDGEIELKIIEPKGGVLCAFWSEVIVFRK